MGNAKPHAHDVWGDGDHLGLFHGTLKAGDCRDAWLFQIPQDAFNVVYTHRVESGCARTGLPPKVTVPIGTASLQVDLNAQDAMELGGVRLLVSTNAGRTLNGEPTTQVSHNWTVPLDPGDWDLPHQEASGFSFLLEADGDVARLEGRITLTIAAHKIPGWTAPLDAAHLDHWNLTNKHAFLAPGVMKLLDATLDVRDPPGTNYVTRVEPIDPPAVELADIIPPGTAQVSLVIVWDPAEADCHPAHQCAPEGWLGNASERWNDKDPFEGGTGYLAYRFHVDEDFTPDSPYATISATHVEADADACLGERGPSAECINLLDEVLEIHVSARFVVYAWQGPIDAGKLKEYVGISSAPAS